MALEESSTLCRFISSTAIESAVGLELVGYLYSINFFFHGQMSALKNIPKGSKALVSYSMNAHNRL